MRRARSRLLFWFLAAVSVIVSATVLAEDAKVALVIGNANYPTAPLRNPINDARAMTKILRGLGFEVIHRENLDFNTLIEELRGFTTRSKNSQVRLLYFAGHGVQAKGRNYLIPVDAKIASEEDFQRKAADLGDVLFRLGTMRTGLNIVILDACRRNPFRSGRLRGGSGKNGLARTDPPKGTLVAYATAPGSVALDAGREENSVYTKYLVANLPTPDQTVEQLFKKIYKSVSMETNNAQKPWVESAFTGEYCFNTGPDNRCGMD